MTRQECSEEISFWIDELKDINLLDQSKDKYNISTLINTITGLSQILSDLNSDFKD